MPLLQSGVWRARGDDSVREALDVAGGLLGVHVDLNLDLTPAERWRSRGGWRARSLPTLGAHAESAPRGLLGELRERGDSLSAVGVGSVAALVREGELAWGTDAGVNAPPLPDPLHSLGFGAPAAAHYQRLFVGGEIVLDNGTLVNVDEREVAARAKECAKRVSDQLG